MFIKCPNWLVRVFAWLTLPVFYYVAWRVWTYEPKPPLPAPPPDDALVRKMASQIKSLSRSERVRAWQSPGLQSRHATWIALKAQYFTMNTKLPGPDKEIDQKTRDHVIAHWKLMMRAHHLSRRGAQTIPEEKGAKLRGYWSDIDCSLQPYSVTVPATYDDRVAFPLIVSLHGHGWYRPIQGHPAPQYKGAFGLNPHGRGATDYKALGELDVLTAIEEVCRDFNIDRDRIYLRGGSMGGTGSWQLGAHYADRFAGIMPVAGNADYTAWTERWGWNEPFDGRFDDLRLQLQETQTARAFAGNLLHLPAYVLHGGGDTIVPVAHARHTVALLRQLHCPVQYREFPNVGHGGFPDATQKDGLGWICGHCREDLPKRVHWQAERMRRGKAYWVRMQQKERPLGPATVDAQVEDRTHLSITTDNLTALAIQRHEKLFNPAKPLFVTIDGDRVIFPPAKAGEWLNLRRDADDQWHDASYLPEPSLSKTAWLEGPIDEALHAPFVVVVGTRSQDELTRALWYQEARQFLSEWRRRNGAACPVVRDVDCTEELADERNLILFGGPADNTVSAVLAPDLPLPQMMRPLTDLRPDTPSLLRPESGDPDLGWFAVYPNPEHPHRLAVIVAGRGPEAIYQVWGRFGNWFNWGVFDSKKYFDYAVFDARSASPESMLLLGWFGTDWQPASGQWWLGSETVRESLAPQYFPPYESAPSDADTLDLVNLRPHKIDQMRGAIGFNRTFFGMPRPRSIGVRSPAFIEYKLDGKWSQLLARGALDNPPGVELTTSRRDSEKVRFIVKGNGRVLGQAVASWHQQPVMIEAPLDGVTTLRLESVSDGGPAWLHMGASWIVPRLYRAAEEEEEEQ